MKTFLLLIVCAAAILSGAGLEITTTEPITGIITGDTVRLSDTHHNCLVTKVEGNWMSVECGSHSHPGVTSESGLVRLIWPWASPTSGTAFVYGFWGSEFSTVRSSPVSLPAFWLPPIEIGPPERFIKIHPPKAVRKYPWDR